MGAGKTTIGRVLAEQLACDFVDSDQLIEERTGADIAWIFDVEGENGFRDRESAVLEELLRTHQGVIATGGGAVMREENRARLEVANVVYITADIEQLVARTEKDKRRPLLQVDDPEARIRELFTLRDPLYRQVSSYVVCTNGRTPKTIAEEILNLIDSE